MTNTVSSAYVTMDQAVETIGQHLMPHEWLGQETLLLTRDSRATEGTAAIGEEATATGTAIGRLNRAVNYLLRALAAGDVKAVVAHGDGKFRAFPSALWTRPGIRAVFRSGELPEDFRVALEGHKADTGKHWMLLPRWELRQLLRGLRPSEEPSDVEVEFRAWLARKIDEHAGSKPPLKKRTWMEAQGAFGSQLTYSAFQRIWMTTVPETWRRSVRARRFKPIP